MSLVDSLVVGTDIAHFGWKSDSGVRSLSFLVPTLLQVVAQKLGLALLKPSPTTLPENGTNSSADLVEAVSLVICEEITWRPSFFWSLVSVDCRPHFSFYQ